MDWQTIAAGLIVIITVVCLLGRFLRRHSRGRPGCGDESCGCGRPRE